MFGIFMESLVIFKLYTGLRLLLGLTLAAWFYLLLKEKECSAAVGLCTYHRSSVIPVSCQQEGICGGRAGRRDLLPDIVDDSHGSHYLLWSL